MCVYKSDKTLETNTKITWSDHNWRITFRSYRKVHKNSMPSTDPKCKTRTHLLMGTKTFAAIYSQKPHASIRLKPFQKDANKGKCNLRHPMTACSHCKNLKYNSWHAIVWPNQHSRQTSMKPNVTRSYFPVWYQHTTRNTQYKEHQYSICSQKKIPST